MDYIAEILNALRDETRFVRLTLSGPKDPKSAEWRKVALHPVQLAAGRRIQAVLQGATKQVMRTVEPAELEARLREFLALGFLHISLQCVDAELHVRITRKGKALVSRGKPSSAVTPAEAAAPHDREKEYPFPAQEPNRFLEILGIMRDGRVLAPMQDKFRQINHFLSILARTELLRRPREEIRIIDSGCGRAFLTLAAYHYLREKRNIAVTMTGIDQNAEVIARAGELRDRLRYAAVAFAQSRILDYQPPAPPHAVLSLHACDTATDEAIAQGVKWGAELILCAPCCQHELHHRLERPEFQAVLRHGILRERLADILTDALRAAALRIMGYRTDVIEFISPESTAKNLLIRAEKAGAGPLRGAVEEYRALRDTWAITPAIETLLGESLQARLAMGAE